LRPRATIIILVAKKDGNAKEPPDMKEMIARGKVERITGDRTTRIHYEKRIVELR
jgi:hypothetical protein